MRYEARLEEDDDSYDGGTKLVILYDGKPVTEYTDGGEPEDNSFYRDWHWVPYELKRAYDLGFCDGREDALR